MAPGGSATALSLCAAGLDPERVMVVEASAYTSERIGESIPPNSRGVLHELGVLPAFLEQEHEPCHGSASSWGSDELGHNDFLFNPYGHGWHLDRRRFDAWLAGEVQAKGVDVRRSTRFVGATARDTTRVELEIQPPGPVQVRTRIVTRFVVDATGARSLYAQRMGATRRLLDDLVVVSGVFERPDEAPMSQQTMLEAVADGWWYAARLPGNRVAVALATGRVQYKQRRFDRPRTWLHDLARTRHLAPVLRACRPSALGLTVRAAPSFLLEPSHGQHWLAVGDAASSYDPISSQGIFKALDDGLRAGRAIAAVVADGDVAGLEAHHAELEDRFSAYAEQRAYFYRVEQRWPTAAFWRERQAVPKSAEARSSRGVVA